MIVLIPVGIVQRYLLTAAAVTSIWVPDELTYTAAGLAGGAMLGLLTNSSRHRTADGP